MVVSGCLVWFDDSKNAAISMSRSATQTKVELFLEELRLIVSSPEAQAFSS